MEGFLVKKVSVWFLITHLGMHHCSVMIEPIRIPLLSVMWLPLLTVCFSRFFKSQQGQRQALACEDTMY